MSKENIFLRLVCIAFFITVTGISFVSSKDSASVSSKLKALRAKNYPKVNHHYEFVATKTHTLSGLQSINCAGAQCNIIADFDNDATKTVSLRLIFWGSATIRWWLAIDGNFSNIGTADDVIVGKAQPLVAVLKNMGDFYEISTQANASVIVQLRKVPLLLSILVDGYPVFEESMPLSWNTTTSWQTVTRDVTIYRSALTSVYILYKN